MKPAAFAWGSISRQQNKALCWWCESSPFRDYNGIIADGAIRSGKTVCLGFSFVIWAMTEFDSQNFALCGKTIASLRRNVISSGAFDYQTAIRWAVNTLAAHMDGVTYPSGHRDTLEVAVRRAALIGVNQTAAKLQLQRMDDMDCGFVEVTAHSGARPEHALWQGRVYHRGGAVTYDGQAYPDFISSTGYGTGQGLCGWNCKHNFFPFFPGLSERAYSDEQLAAYEARDIEYNGKLYTRYEASQRQRALERRVRAAKRQYLAEDAAGLDTTNAAVKLRRAREQLRHFTQETGLPLDNSRISKATAGAARYYRSWANVPGFDAPKTLADYYQIKYNDPERWVRLRRDHDTLYSIAQKDWSPEFKRKAVEVFQAFKAAGVEISDHGVARFLSRSHGAKRYSPFTVDDILSQIQQPVNFVQSNVRRIRFYRSIAVITTPDDIIISIVRRDTAKTDWRPFGE